MLEQLVAIQETAKKQRRIRELYAVRVRRLYAGGGEIIFGEEGT